MIFYLNLRSQVMGAELVLIIMGVWDKLMISICYVQVLKAYKECLIYGINFLVVMASYLMPLKLCVSYFIMVSIVVRFPSIQFT